jgi:mannonate dehydratase
MGEDVVEVIERFGGSRIIYVHSRDVVGEVPTFHETFLDSESGNYDEVEVRSTLRDVGFDGVMTPDHVPLMEGETDWEFGSIHGRAFTVGYLKGLLAGIRKRDD